MKSILSSFFLFWLLESVFGAGIDLELFPAYRDTPPAPSTNIPSLFNAKFAANKPLLNILELGFYVDLEIGTPGQRFTLLVDTGSTAVLVPAPTCGEEGNCTNETTLYDGAKSSTFVNTTVAVPMIFGGGRAFCRAGYDEISFGEFHLSNTSFMFCDPLAQIPPGNASGIFGLERNNNRLKPLASIMENILLAPSNNFTQKLVGFYMTGKTASLQLDGGGGSIGPGGVMTIGGLNEDYYEGDVNWVGVTEKAMGNGQWELKIDGLWVDGVEIPLTFASHSTISTLSSKSGAFSGTVAPVQPTTSKKPSTKNPIKKTTTLITLITSTKIPSKTKTKTTTITSLSTSKPTKTKQPTKIVTVTVTSKKPVKQTIKKTTKTTKLATVVTESPTDVVQQVITRSSSEVVIVPPVPSSALTSGSVSKVSPTVGSTAGSTGSALEVTSPIGENSTASASEVTSNAIESSNSASSTTSTSSPSTTNTTIANTVLIDTGATFIYGPGAILETLYAHVGGHRMGDGVLAQYFQFPCNKTPEVTFGVGGVKYIIPRAELIMFSDEFGDCVGSLTDVGATFDGKGATSTSHWVFGLSFLKNVYTGFRYDPDPAVGFATLKRGLEKKETTRTEPEDEETKAKAKELVRNI